MGALSFRSFMARFLLSWAPETEPEEEEEAPAKLAPFVPDKSLGSGFGGLGGLGFGVAEV